MKISSRSLCKASAIRLALFWVIAGLARANAAADITAQWDFNDIGNDNQSRANIGGYIGFFAGAARRSPGGGGMSGEPGDYALDPMALNRGQGTSEAGGFYIAQPEFRNALRLATGSQTFSITYSQFLISTPNSTAFWADAPGVEGGVGLKAHSPWSDGVAYFDTSGCCATGLQRTSGFLGATLGVWELMAFTYDHGTRSIYHHGGSGETTLIAQTMGGSPVVTDFNAFFVGADNSFQQTMDARIDNFTIWTGALTQQEIHLLPVPEPGASLACGFGAVFALLRRKAMRV